MWLAGAKGTSKFFGKKCNRKASSACIRSSCTTCRVSYFSRRHQFEDYTIRDLKYDGCLMSCCWMQFIQLLGNYSQENLCYHQTTYFRYLFSSRRRKIWCTGTYAVFRLNLDIQVRRQYDDQQSTHFQFATISNH